MASFCGSFLWLYNGRNTCPKLRRLYRLLFDMLFKNKMYNLLLLTLRTVCHIPRSNSSTRAKEEFPRAATQYILYFLSYWGEEEYWIRSRVPWFKNQIVPKVIQWKMSLPLTTILQFPSLRQLLVLTILCPSCDRLRWYIHAYLCAFSLPLLFLTWMATNYTLIFSH